MVKVLFMMINMNVGGMEKALLNMISEMDKNKYDITVLMLEKYGGFLENIPNYVKVEYLKNYKDIKALLNQPPKYIVKELLKKRKFIRAINIAFLHLISKLIDNRKLYYRYIFKDYKKINEDYDIAVAYAGPTDYITYYVLNKIDAKKKIQWIHFDITKIGFNYRFAKDQYENFERVFIVSDEARNKFIKEIPKLKEKTETFHNIVSKKDIEESLKSKVTFQDEFNGLRILTVGRLSIEKGQDISIQAAKRLIDEGYNIKWYCIGEGNARGYYEELINKNNLNNRFILLGSNNNPYKFIDKSDIYVQTSRYEGYCITLAEARILNKPIITTNFAGAKEQIIDNKTGLICECTVDGIYKSVKRLIVSRDLRDELSKNLKLDNNKFTNDLYKFEKIL